MDAHIYNQSVLSEEKCFTPTAVFKSWNTPIMAFPRETEFTDLKTKYGMLYGKISIRAYCMSTAVVHLILVVFFSWKSTASSAGDEQFKHLVMPVTKNIGAWLNISEAAGFPIPTTRFLKSECSLLTYHESRVSDAYIQPLSLSVTTYDTRQAIIIFHVFSFAFQFLNCLSEKNYYEIFQYGQTHLSHFIEYSFSASLMITTMSVQLGVLDIYTLLGVFCNGWACMIFGLLAEVMFENNMKAIEVPIITFRKQVSITKAKIKPHWIAHIAGWITLVFSIVAVVSNLSTFTTCMDTVRIPSFVYPIVVLEVVFFSAFGVVQIVEFCNKPEFDPDSNTTRDQKYAKRVIWAFITEIAYITLSLFAKTSLGIAIYYGG